MVPTLYSSKLNFVPRQDLITQKPIAIEVLSTNDSSNSIKSIYKTSIRQNIESVDKNDQIYKDDSQLLFNCKRFSPMNSFDQKECSYDPRNDPMMLNQSSNDNLEFSFSDLDLEASAVELDSLEEYLVSSTFTNCSSNKSAIYSYNNYSDLVSEKCDAEFETESEGETYMGKFMNHTAIYKNLHKPSLTKLLDSGKCI